MAQSPRPRPPRVETSDQVTPPADVLDYFRSRRLSPQFSWLDVWGEEHAHAFTVAKVTDENVLAAFRATIDDAIARGLGYEEWRAQLEPRLRALGWWGPRTVADPATGETKRVDFSSPRRLQNIFWSNMRAARAAGQWERAQASKRVLPYLLYVETTAAEPRNEHLTWVGTILPVDHPWWETHFPPNGWGCKCSVRQIGRVEAKRLGGVSQDPVVETVPFRNRRTGEVTEVPVGIDPGWHTNPGRARGRQLGEILTDRLAVQPPEVARALIERFHADGGFEAQVYAAQRRGAERDELRRRGRSQAEIDAQKPWQNAHTPLAVLPDDVAGAIGAPHRIVTVTDAALAHNPTHHMAPWEWSRAQKMLDVGQVMRRPSDGATMVFARRDEAGRRWWYLVLNPVGPDGRITAHTLMRAPDRYVVKERARGAPVRSETGEVVAEGRP